MSLVLLPPQNFVKTTTPFYWQRIITSTKTSCCRVVCCS